MTKEDVKVAGGISVPTVGGIVFVILKLTDVIDWSWWWVTAPFWVPVAATALLASVYVGVLAYKMRKLRKH